MKVAILAPLVSPIRDPHQGGSQAFVSGLARGLVARGHAVHLYAASGSEVRGLDVIDTGVDHRDLAATLYRPARGASGVPSVAARAFAHVFEMVRENQYDVFHNHAFDAPAIGFACALRAPVVHTLHLPPEAVVAGALRQAIGRDRPPTVACVSLTQAAAWRQLVPVAAILPPYIPTRRIRFSPRAGSGAVFAGRFSPEKGAADAIAIARIAGVQIEVFGDRYDPEYARKEIDVHASEQGVVVHPGVPQTTLWEAMARAAVVVCPAKWEEPFGMVAAESQACGTPVVAFRRGGLHEVIVDGVTGFLVTPDDLQAAADAVTNAPALSRWACRRHSESDLDIERSLDGHEQLYERVVAAGLRARSHA